MINKSNTYSILSLGFSIAKLIKQAVTKLEIWKKDA